MDSINVFLAEFVISLPTFFNLHDMGDLQYVLHRIFRTIPYLGGRDDLLRALGENRVDVSRGVEQRLYGRRGARRRSGQRRYRELRPHFRDAARIRARGEERLSGGGELRTAPFFSP